MPAHTITINSTYSGITKSATTSKTIENFSTLDVNIAQNQTDKNVIWTADVSQIQTLVLFATTDCTIETNNATTPGNTIDLKANEPIEWHLNSEFANPLTVDVTTLYVTTGAVGAAGCDLTIHMGIDATP